MDIYQQMMAYYRRYPLMRVDDYIKLLYQSEFFGGHFIASEDDALRRLNAEISSCVIQRTQKEAFSDDFLNMSRVNLRPFVREQKNIVTLNRLFVASNAKNHGSEERFKQKLDDFLFLVKNKKIDLPYLSSKRHVNEYIAKGMPIPIHSSAVKLNYFPAYRVVRKDFWFLFDAIEAIDDLLETNLTVTIAIEGNSGAGKSFFARVLKEYYNANLLTADDFFLPVSMRSEQRLSQIGGNIHYERLRKTLLKMKDGDAFDYQRYDCHTDSFVTKHAQPGRVNIVEGCYSLHPETIDLYNFGILLTVNKMEQMRRILDRDGAEIAARYKMEWIPKEDAYLACLNTGNLKTITLNTDPFDFEF